MSPDARTWTFHLRHGVQWHKGFGEFTSDDVAFTIKRMADPKTGSQYSANFRQIESVDTPDAYTVVWHLTQPSPFVYAFCCMPRFGGYMQSRKAVEQLGDKLRLNPVGTGPFEFVGYEPKQKIVCACVRPVLGRQAEDRSAGGAVPHRDRRRARSPSSRATWT